MAYLTGMMYTTSWAYFVQLIIIVFDYTLSAEDEFHNWLDSVAPDIMNTPIVMPTLSLDERVALKEKIIKRKIESRLRYQKVKAQRLRDSEIPKEELDEWMAKRLKGLET